MLIVKWTDCHSQKRAIDDLTCLVSLACGKVASSYWHMQIDK